MSPSRRLSHAAIGPRESRCCRLSRRRRFPASAAILRPRTSQARRSRSSRGDPAGCRRETPDSGTATRSGRAPSRACGSMSARSVRSGSARNHTGPRAPRFHRSTSASHSCFGLAVSAMAGANDSASTGRANGWCMPTLMPGVDAAAARNSPSARVTGLPVARIGDRGGHRRSPGRSAASTPSAGSRSTGNWNSPRIAR